MNGEPFDWANFESLLFDAAYQALTTHFARHPNETFYAAALHGLYRETGDVIYLPALAINSEQSFLQDHPQDLNTSLLSVRWNPPDWHWPILEEFQNETLNSQQTALIAYATQDSEAHWNRAEKQLLSSLLRVCKKLRTALRKAIRSLHPDFVVLMLTPDDKETEELVRRCLPAPLMTKLFPELDSIEMERRLVASFAVPDQVNYHLQRLQSSDTSEEAKLALRALGKPVLAGLIDLLTDSEHGWKAAKLLGELNIPSPTLMIALRGQIQKPVLAKNYDGIAHRNWCARALVLLGNADFLLIHIDTLDNEMAVTGLCAPLSSFRDYQHQPRKLDYEPIHRLLSIRPDLTKRVEKEIEPGSSYCSILIDEVPNVLAALSSPHRAIRRHAVSVLGERNLGAKSSKAILPALALRIANDTDNYVRFLSILSLQEWKKTGHPYQDVVQSALQDRDERVRNAAQSWLDELQ
jgi:hypothetical protein